jgi:putative transcriptional regulator
MRGILGKMPGILDIGRTLCLYPRVGGREQTLGNRLRVARAERNLSQDELARAVGVSRQTVSSVETGQYCPSALLAFRLARAVEWPVDQLFWMQGESDDSGKRRA